MTPIDMLRGLRRRHYRVVLADPPWKFRPHSPPNRNTASPRHVERHYPTMTLPAIKAIPVRDLCARDGCHLFLWATGPHLPQALDLMAAWGFKYSGVGFVWVKFKKTFDPNQLRLLPTADGDLHVGLGFTTRKNAEFCLLGRRGNARRLAKDVREIILAPRREHSRKPDEAHDRIERYAAGPYLELFGRQRRKGWTVRGDQVERFK